MTARRPVSLTLFCLAVPLIASAAAARAGEVLVPIQFDRVFLRQGLIERVFTDPDLTAQAWNDGTGCNYLTLSDPALETGDGRLRIRSRAVARVGHLLGERCIVVLDWSGFVETVERPAIDPGAPVIRFTVEDSSLYGEDGTKSTATGVIWDWVKRYVHPRLEADSIDLGAALADLRAFLPLVLADRDSERVRALIDSVALAAVEPNDAGLAATIRFQLGERAPATPGAAPEPTLTSEELRRWEQSWQHWDAFLTFVVKYGAGDTAQLDQRRELFDVLLEARYDILKALTPSAPGAPDPVPALFLETWARLAPVLRQSSSGLPGQRTWRYLSFISAGDALAAIDRLGPDIGLEISADGLRRLVRTLAPEAAADPLLYSSEVDPELRRLFGFGPPLPPAAENSAVDLSFLWPRAAWATLEPDPEIIKRLNRWAPTRDDVDAYLPLARDLLRTTTELTLTANPLDDEFRPLYRWMLLATAWQESCWRQFVRVGAALKPIRSAAGSVGIMQVNQNVWRGLYDVRSLQGDIAYNARAGSEILVHYLRDYAIARGEHRETGSLDNLARATYAVYNGGPGHLRRYRQKKTPTSLQRIDDAFWKKYQSVKMGKELQVAGCYGESLPSD